MQNSADIEEQFNLVAEEYDSSRRIFIPCFDDYYEATTAFAAAFVGNPRRIIDLGAGTGLLTMYYFRHFPAAEYILCDIAGDMLEVAKRRFENIGNISCQVLDYTRDLPEGEFDLVISALSIHHLENDRKAALFGNIRRQLTPGGWFINYDQFCKESQVLDDALNKYWVNHLYSSTLSARELECWQERRKLDRECSAASELDMLKKCQYKNTELIYESGKFGVIAAQA